MKSSLFTLLIAFLAIFILFIVWIAFIAFSYGQINTNNDLFGKNECNNIFVMNNNNKTLMTNNDVVQTTKCIYFNYEQNQYNIVMYALWLIFGPVFGIILYLIMQCCYGLRKILYNNEMEEEQETYLSRKMTNRRACCSNRRYLQNSLYSNNTTLSP